MTEGLFFAVVAVELLLASIGSWILAFRRTGRARTIPLAFAIASTLSVVAGSVAAIPWFVQYPAYLSRPMEGPETALTVVILAVFALYLTSAVWTLIRHVHTYIGERHTIPDPNVR